MLEAPAEHIDEDELAALARLVEETVDCATVEESVGHGLEFHRGVALAWRNRALISSRASRARTWRGISQADATDRTRAEHLAIPTSLEHHRPDLARAWATVDEAAVEA